MAVNQELRSVLSEADPIAADLLLSALAAAAGSGRRATCTTPFPPSLFQSADNERDYAALLANVEALPGSGHLATAVDSLSQQQLTLLHWLLTHPRRPVLAIRRCTLRQVQDQMPLSTGWLADVGRNPGLRPHAVLQLSQPPTSLTDGSGGRVLAFHGTSMENMHSILHHGLLNASGTRLERTGYVFGKGIYFSSEPHVAFAFSLPADGWQGSGLGKRLRCLLCCSVEREHALDSRADSLIPDKYILVERMDAVQMHFVFVYVDTFPVAAAAALSTPSPRQAAAVSPAAGAQAQQQWTPQLAAHGEVHGAAHGQAQGEPQRGSLLLWVIAVYAVWLMYVGLQDNWPFIRRVLRRKFGIKL